MTRETMPVGQIGNEMVFEGVNNSTVEIGRIVVPSSRVKLVEASITRTTANATAYDAGDVVSNSTISTACTYMTFDNLAQRSGGSGTITDVFAIDSANQAVKPNQRLYLFDTPPATTILVDGSSWIQPTTDMRKGQAEIDFASWSVTGSSTAGCSISHRQGLAIGFECVSTDDALYGVVIERGTTYTPVTGERWDYRIKVLRD